MTFTVIMARGIPIIEATILAIVVVVSSSIVSAFMEYLKMNEIAYYSEKLLE
ncbi:hypothetical protein [Flavobacterium sp. LB2P74]|uniref:hypothetical protein n=1 Tax=Flavobacterium sp. LB2P74 TaxID=3401717 RepID=UPI003AB07FE2